MCSSDLGELGSIRSGALRRVCLRDRIDFYDLHRGCADWKGGREAALLRNDRFRFEPELQSNLVSSGPGEENFDVRQAGNFILLGARIELAAKEFLIEITVEMRSQIVSHEVVDFIKRLAVGLLSTCARTGVDERISLRTRDLVVGIVVDKPMEQKFSLR